MTVAIVLLVMMSAYFSATETAFSCLNKIRMKSRAESGDHRAALAMDLVEDYDRLISTILIGNNIVNITASTVGTVLFTKLYAAYGPTVSISAPSSRHATGASEPSVSRKIIPTVKSAGSLAIR